MYHILLPYISSKGERERRGRRNYLKISVLAKVVLCCRMYRGHLPGLLDVQKDSKLLLKWASHH